MRNRFLILALVTVFPYLIVPDLYASALDVDEAVAEVGAFSGNVVVIRGGEKFQVTTGTKLKPGDKIVTDSAGTVQLLHKDGSIMYVGTSSSLTLMAPARLSLIEGALRVLAEGAFYVEPQNHPTIWASGHGGEFLVSLSSEDLQVMGVTGDVSMGNSKMTLGKTVALQRKQSAGPARELAGIP